MNSRIKTYYGHYESSKYSKELDCAIRDELKNKEIIQQNNLTIGELYSFLVDKKCSDELDYYESVSPLKTEIAFTINDIEFYKIINILKVFAEECCEKEYSIVDDNSSISVFLNGYNKLINVAKFPYNKGRKGTLSKKEAKAKANQLVKDLNRKNKQMRFKSQC